ncbi:M17 family metallopeptidase [Metamycoplasma hominis]|uniref:M17 family metallopeptidase n=1 Tax=Metamycoplasma hominis TaxID=2098 RepID=UPI000DDFEF81|nr:leucyl aminopeptidase family protein [Metamycoplasma hominis]RBI33732.1 leucyl aminopeptidase family protein [Metamycoplasma hominis]
MNSIYYETKRNKDMLLTAVYEGSNASLNIAKKDNHITEDFKKNEAFIYIPKTVDNYFSFLKVVDKILSSNRRNYQINIASFVKENVVSTEEVFRAFVSKLAFKNANLYSVKTKENKQEKTITLFYADKSYEELVERLSIILEATNKARSLQMTPPNVATSEYIAKVVKEDLENIPGLSIKVLDRDNIKKNNMGLMLAVNSGSSYEPRVLIAEYNGNPESKEKYVYVGKGITFDTGGYNTKGYYMDGMKFDMSGSVIVAYAVKAIAQLKLKANVAAIMMITDNAIDTHPTMPESVIKSMSGLTVEITDTDAEGRLVLADGLYYGASKLNASLLIDAATLTGSMERALGKTYSGIWSTSEQRWEDFDKAAKIAHEKVWRMPLHDDYDKPNKESKVADLNNYNNSEKSDCNTAAMFLKHFTNNVDYIHCDIAGTADNKGVGLGILVSTFVELAANQK